VDHLHLVGGRVNGTVLADGSSRRVQAEFGAGGTLLSLNVH
jgi:hypothetical protein